VYHEPDALIEHREDAARLRIALALSALFAILLWLIMIVESMTGVALPEYGIYPGTAGGLLGILTAPFIHGSPEHLLANTLPIVILGTALLYGYPKASRIVLPVLFLGTGLGVWLIGRPSHHIGASGVIFGVMFFVFVSGVLRWDKRAIGLSAAAFFLYGGMVWEVFPIRPQISYEAHLCGALLGIALAFLLRKLDPPPAPKRYSWDVEPEPPSE
jgi:membrane associated rhomboid family serine protease